MFKLIGAVANLEEIEDFVAEDFDAARHRCEIRIRGLEEGVEPRWSDFVFAAEIDFRPDGSEEPEILVDLTVYHESRKDRAFTADAVVARIADLYALDDCPPLITTSVEPFRPIEGRVLLPMCNTSFATMSEDELILWSEIRRLVHLLEGGRNATL